MPYDYGQSTQDGYVVFSPLIREISFMPSWAEGRMVGVGMLSQQEAPIEGYQIDYPSRISSQRDYNSAGGWWVYLDPSNEASQQWTVRCYEGSSNIYSTYNVPYTSWENRFYISLSGNDLAVIFASEFGNAEMCRFFDAAFSAPFYGTVWLQKYSTSTLLRPKLSGIWLNPQPTVVIPAGQSVTGPGSVVHKMFNVISNVTNNGENLMGTLSEAYTHAAASRWDGFVVWKTPVMQLNHLPDWNKAREYAFALIPRAYAPDPRGTINENNIQSTYGYSRLIGVWVRMMPNSESNGKWRMCMYKDRGHQMYYTWDVDYSIFESREISIQAQWGGDITVSLGGIEQIRYKYRGSEVFLPALYVLKSSSSLLRSIPVVEMNTRITPMPEAPPSVVMHYAELKMNRTVEDVEGDYYATMNPAYPWPTNNDAGPSVQRMQYQAYAVFRGSMTRLEFSPNWNQCRDFAVGLLSDYNDMVYRRDRNTDEYHVDYPYNIGQYWHPNRRSYSHWARILPHNGDETSNQWILRFYWGSASRWMGTRERGQNQAASYDSMMDRGNVWLEWKTFNQVRYGHGPEVNSYLYTHNVGSYERGPSSTNDPAMYGAIYMAKLYSSTLPADFKPVQRFKVRWGCHRYSTHGDYGCGVPFTSSG
jgi:hypothetical protein